MEFIDILKAKYAKEKEYLDINDQMGTLRQIMDAKQQTAIASDKPQFQTLLNLRDTKAAEIKAIEKQLRDAATGV